MPNQLKGNADAIGVSIRDPLPRHTSFVSASSGGRLRHGPQVRWHGLTTPAGGKVTVRSTVRISRGLPSSVHSIVNDGIRVRSAGGIRTTGSQHSTPIVPAHAVTLDPASATEGARVGTSVDFTEHVANNGYLPDSYDLKRRRRSSPRSVVAMTKLPDLPGLPGSPGRSTAAGTALAVSGATSVQFGAALAATLFPLVGPVGTVLLRFLGAALVLVLLTRPWRVRWGARDLRTVVAFGLVFVVMNLSLYVAISRLPLATAITLEFLGPLGVAIITAATWAQRGWALPAAAGVALIGGSLRAGDLVGVVAALGAACAWASYILVSRRMGTSDHALAGLALAAVLGAVLTLPAGILAAGADLVQPRTLALGLIVGVVSSAIPYSLDLLALRRLTTAVFGVLTSLNPALAALAGLVVLQELPPHRQLVGIALVMVASAGVTLTGSAGSTLRPGGPPRAVRQPGRRPRPAQHPSRTR